ncbi:MAG: Tat pathway signal protein [Sphingomonadales bacterium 32-68-7]|nr:MAG: Tat pathway signal protein [Sphingomonadales bacterium 12-68-11]OYX09440.1 MAG: Tat pathway signal protein [Sphingomonadales bacterium 32-68-7]
MNRRQLLIGGGALAAIGASGAAWSASRMGSAADYADATQAMRAALAAQPGARDLIRYATLAPNGHNAQPWRFAAAPGLITLRPDLARRTPVVDPDDHHLFVSLGCAAENLALAAAARGYAGEPVFAAAGGGTIAFAHRPGRARPSALFEAILVRQSTRAEYDGRAVAPSALQMLAEAARNPLVDLVLITERSALGAIRDLVVTGNSAQMADAAFVRELKSWLRFNPAQALRTRDGLYSVASGNPALPDWLGPVAFDWLTPVAAQNDSYARQIVSSAGIAVFVGAREDREHWIAVGRACQRFALQATALGLKHAFINQPVEVPALRPDLAALIGLPGRRPDIVMRFGHGPTLPYSPRRPVASVMAA